MRIRTSRAGDAACQRGFTLLELLVVLTIIGFIGLLIPGFIFRGGSSLELDRAANAFAEGLREVQSRALSENDETLFAVDVERRQFRPGLAATPIQIGAGIDLELITARTERSGEGTGRIRFFPDGSSTGGRILLVDDRQRRTIEIDWLTGRVRVNADAR